MSLDSAIGISTSGLRAISAQLRTVSNNVANAEVPGYTRKTLPTRAVTADGLGIGVGVEQPARVTDAALQRAVWAREASFAAADTRASILAPIESLHGRPEAGDSLAGLLGKLQQGFITLAADPSSASLQVEVVTQAETLAARIREMAGAVTAARNRAQEELVAGVAEANRLLGEAGVLTREIVRLRNEVLGTAELEDKRDAIIGQLSALLDIRVVLKENGEMQAFTRGGLSIPLRPDAFSTRGAELGPGAFYDPEGGTVPPLLLSDPTRAAGAVDVTRGQVGGRLGALLSLRDETLPRFTAELDEFAHKLARRFEQQGLRLFTDTSGNVPHEGGVVPQARYIGFSSEIRVFALLLETPRLVRDGTHAIPAGIPGFPATREVQPPYGDPFVPNPATGPQGFDQLIRRILDHTFGATLGLGRPHDPAFLIQGLGPTGRLSSPIPAAATLSAFASSLVATQTAEHAAAKASAESERSTRDLLANRYADAVGVNLDQEMALLVQLQNAYQANARVLTTVQAVWDALLASVR
ncbi:flagellar basal body protein [Elioraea tepida]|uniref:Flagellar hook-associated protein 1 n=1 Tax=Elioraea tepida TaxID=2843330 RepID=A0A975U136_9PROT|nr:flagellar basal body rod C-terminal domain-containing protein [Elioraea tepida]QXM24300.1 flagellar basal body protein [Elioraea tepida]